MMAHTPPYDLLDLGNEYILRVDVPESIDSEKARASWRDGVLELRLPKLRSGVSVEKEKEKPSDEASLVPEPKKPDAA